MSHKLATMAVAAAALLIGTTTGRGASRIFIACAAGFLEWHWIAFRRLLHELSTRPVATQAIISTRQAVLRDFEMEDRE
jgi:hypothetical protein